MCKRLLTAIGYTFGAIVISILILFISWAFFKYVDLPYRSITLKATQVQANSDGSNIKIISAVETNETIELETSLAVYIIAILSFFGWIFVVLFGGVGLFALPIDMIN
jgi:LMBR1 domain-containing protein 1